MPDLGNEVCRAYLRLVPKASWSTMFEQWLEQDHTREFDMPEEASEEPKDGNATSDT